MIQYNRFYEDPELSSIFPYPVGDELIKTLSGADTMASALNKLYQGKNLTLACRGSSGAIIAAMLSSKLNVGKIIHIKKQGESSHSDSLPYFGSIKGTKIIIVDDFISSGDTIGEIYKKLKNGYVGESGFSVEGLCVSNSISVKGISYWEGENERDLIINTLIGYKISDDEKYTKINLNSNEHTQLPISA